MSSLPKLRRLEMRVPRRSVTIRLVLPFELENGHELIFEGEGPTYDHAAADLEQQLYDWREAVSSFDSAGERLL